MSTGLSLGHALWQLQVEGDFVTVYDNEGFGIKIFNIFPARMA